MFLGDTEVPKDDCLNMTTIEVEVEDSATRLIDMNIYSVFLDSETGTDCATA